MQITNIMKKNLNIKKYALLSNKFKMQPKTIFDINGQSQIFAPKTFLITYTKRNHKNLLNRYNIQVIVLFLLIYR